MKENYKWSVFPEEIENKSIEGNIDVQLKYDNEAKTIEWIISPNVIIRHYYSNNCIKEITDIRIEIVEEFIIKKNKKTYILPMYMIESYEDYANIYIYFQ